MGLDIPGSLLYPPGLIRAHRSRLSIRLIIDMPCFNCKGGGVGVHVLLVNFLKWRLLKLFSVGATKNENAASFGMEVRLPAFI